MTDTPNGVAFYRLASLAVISVIVVALTIAKATSVSKLA